MEVVDLPGVAALLVLAALCLARLELLVVELLGFIIETLSQSCMGSRNFSI